MCCLICSSNLGTPIDDLDQKLIASVGQIFSQYTRGNQIKSDFLATPTTRYLNQMIYDSIVQQLPIPTPITLDHRTDRREEEKETNSCKDTPFKTIKIHVFRYKNTNNSRKRLYCPKHALSLTQTYWHT